MWALIAEDGVTVEAVVTPDVPANVLQELMASRTLIEMTVANSPAWVHGSWDGTRFHPPTEKETHGALR